MKRSVVYLLVLLVVINAFTLLINVYPSAVSTRATSSSDVATVSLYVEGSPAREIVALNATKNSGGTTGVYRTSGGDVMQDGSVEISVQPDKEVPLAEEGLSYLQILSVLIVLFLIILPVLLVKRKKSEKRAKSKRTR